MVLAVAACAVTLLLSLTLHLTSWPLQFADAAQEDFNCYKGSSLYQPVPVDCRNEDKSYNGSWYCATVEICELSIDKNRDCAVTRGCAKEEQCGAISSDGTVMEIPGSSQKLAGMDITVSCCLNGKPSSSNPYANICNSAASLQASGALSRGLGVSLAVSVVIAVLSSI